MAPAGLVAAVFEIIAYMQEGTSNHLMRCSILVAGALVVLAIGRHLWSKNETIETTPTTLEKGIANLYRHGWQVVVLEEHPHPT